MYKLLKDRINIKILCLSIVFAMISFFTDNIIFDKIQIQRQHYLTLKLIYVILIVCIGQLICKLVYAIKFHKKSLNWKPQRVLNIKSPCGF